MCDSITRLDIWRKECICFLSLHGREDSLFCFYFHISKSVQSHLNTTIWICKLSICNYLSIHLQYYTDLESTREGSGYFFILVNYSAVCMYHNRKESFSPDHSKNDHTIHKHKNPQSFDYYTLKWIWSDWIRNNNYV